MANKSNNGNRKKNNTCIPMMGNKNKTSYQQSMGRQVFDKRRNDSGKIKH